MNSKFLFLVNPSAGAKKINWQEEISKYFASKPYEVELFTIPKDADASQLKKKILSCRPSKVIAVGGDGTLKLIATAILDVDIPIGILPGGSANGMAKELGIPLNAAEALDVIENGKLINIHLLEINSELCIHLSDIGFNALVVKKFEDDEAKGMWGYVKAAWRALFGHRKMIADIKTDKEMIRREAKMIVIANGTSYGSGAMINPKGRLDDNAFEVVIVRRISFRELFKMMITHHPYNPKKTEIFQTRSLHVRSKHRTHFQVDGEYLGRVNEVKAEILPNVLHIIVPDDYRR